MNKAEGHPDFSVSVFEDWQNRSQEENTEENISTQEELFRVRVGTIIFIAGVMILYYYINYIV